MWAMGVLMRVNRQHDAVRLIAAVNAMTSACSTEGNNDNPITLAYINHSNDEPLRACFRMRGTRLSLRLRAVRGWASTQQGGAAAA
jgi:hypothetical protein